MKRWTNGLSGREQAWPRLNLHDPAAENCGSSRQNSSRECGYPLSGRVTRKLKFRGCRHLVESPRPPVDSRHSYLLSSNSGAHSKTVPAAPYRHYAASQANLSITRSCGGRPAGHPDGITEIATGYLQRAEATPSHLRDTTAWLGGSSHFFRNNPHRSIR